VVHTELITVTPQRGPVILARRPAAVQPDGPDGAIRLFIPDENQSLLHDPDAGGLGLWRVAEGITGARLQNRLVFQLGASAHPLIRRTTSDLR